MSDVSVQFVRSPDGDWVGMYVNGELVAENHSLQEEDVVNALTDRHGLSLKLNQTRWDWDLEKDGGRLPDQLSEVTFTDGG
jgi:hypothetical protein